MRQRAPVRLLRALLVTATVLSLAGAGHLLGGGVLPPAGLLLVLGLCVLAPVAWLTGRRPAPARLLAVMGAAQLGLHEAFTALSAAACPGGPHGHHAAPAAGPPCLPGILPGAGHHELTGAGPAMLGAHALAVAATAVLLARAESGLRWALEWMRPLLAPPRPPLLFLAAAQPCPPPPGHPVLSWRGLYRDHVRGPPAATGPRSPGRA